MTSGNTKESPVARPVYQNDVPFHTHVVGCDSHSRSNGYCAFWPPSRHDLRLSFSLPEKRGQWQCVITPTRVYFWRTRNGSTMKQIESVCKQLEKAQYSIAAGQTPSKIFEPFFVRTLQNSNCFDLRTQKI